MLYILFLCFRIRKFHLFSVNIFVKNIRRRSPLWHYTTHTHVHIYRCQIARQKCLLPHLSHPKPNKTHTEWKIPEYFALPLVRMAHVEHKTCVIYCVSHDYYDFFFTLLSSSFLFACATEIRVVCSVSCWKIVV